MNICKQIAALGLTLLLASCATTGPQKGQGSGDQVIPLIGSYQVHRFTLDNGLKVLVVENHSSPTFAYQTWFRVGSRDEVPGYTGLAHLFEHMMFKETKNLKDGEYMRILETQGVEGLNAFTSHDYTAYIQQLPKDKLDLIAKLESDRMVNLIIDDKKFKTETDVVQNERRFRNENSPDGLMEQEIFELAFTKHPYRWPVVGYQQDLDRMSGKDAVEFYRSFYSPNNAAIIVVGDVDPKEVLSVVKKHYGAIPSQPPVNRVIEAEPVQTTPKRKPLKLSIKVEKLILGYHVPEVAHDDIPALNVLRAVLAGGKSSRLHRALVETGIVASIEAPDFAERDPSLFMFYVNLQKAKKATQAESIILREIAKLNKELVSDSELQRAKNRLNFHFYDGMDSNYEKARFVGQYETIAGDFRKGIQQQEKIASITAQDVQAVVKRYFDPSNRAVITGVPK